MSAEPSSTPSSPSPVLDDERPPPRGFIPWFRDIIYAWGPAIIAVLLIRTFIFEPFRIPSGSMVPSLLIGDHVLVTKFSYGVWVPFTGIELVDIGDPDRGDIIVFKYPKNPKLNYIKRVVGISGDKIRVANNQIFIDGEAQDRTFLDKYDFIDDSCNVRRTRQYTENLDGVAHEILTNSGLGPG
ncbi:MAG: signal peptidase I, partial [Proteobacteria bacterium]|nr:signal peptidase I [Pseudomonadota bacterium]